MKQFLDMPWILPTLTIINTGQADGLDSFDFLNNH